MGAKLRNELLKAGSRHRRKVDKPWCNAQSPCFELRQSGKAPDSVPSGMPFPIVCVCRCGFWRTIRIIFPPRMPSAIAELRLGAAAPEIWARHCDETEFQLHQTERAWTMEVMREREGPGPLYSVGRV
jgi:hypothetical protein